jgi:hypothetical protein
MRKSLIIILNSLEDLREVYEYNNRRDLSIIFAVV